MGAKLTDWIYMNPVKIRTDRIFSETKFGINQACLFSTSPYGGPIAIAMRNSSSWDVIIKTCAGKILSTLKAHNVFKIYWTRYQRLVIVNDKGRVLVYTPLGKLKNQFLMSEESTVKESRIYHASAGNTGLAVLTNNNRIFAVNSVMEPVPWRIPDIASTVSPSAWCVVTSTMQTTILFVACGTFYGGMQGVAPRALSLPWKVDTGEYLSLTTNWDCSKLALLHSNGILQVADSEFTLISTITLSFSHDILKALDLLWCGNDVLAMKSSHQSLYMISLCSDEYTYKFDDKIFIGMEPDGVKVFSDDNLTLLTQVPEVVENVIGVASPEPGAVLFEASEKLKEGTYGVYEYIRMIENNMEKAVQQCLVAAAHQFDLALQNKLLEAAALGKSFLHRQDASQFVDICRVIRVLNALRKPYIGIAISFLQSEELKIDTLIDRLIDLDHWPLALKLCQYMKVPSKQGVYRVLAHWSSKKIENAKAEKDAGKIPDYKSLCDSIVGKFSNYPEVSFADVAMKAADADLNELAVFLLDKETRLDRQVVMLLKLNKIDKALAKAARSQQPDLLQLVLAHLKSTHKKEVIDLLMLKLPQALCLYQDHLKEEAPRHLLALYVQKNDHYRQALHHLKESEMTALNPFDNKEKIMSLSNAEKCLRDAKEQSIAQSISETAELLKICEIFDGKSGFVQVDRTCMRSVYVWAAGHQEEGLMEQLKKTFKLSEKVCFTWKVDGYASSQLWHHLESLSKSRKSFTTYMPFVEACARYGNKDLCKTYVAKLTNPDEVVEGMLLLGKPIEAAKYAAEKKLFATLENIHARYRSDKDVTPMIAGILKSM